MNRTDEVNDIKPPDKDNDFVKNKSEACEFHIADDGADGGVSDEAADEAVKKLKRAKRAYDKPQLDDPKELRKAYEAEKSETVKLKKRLEEIEKALEKQKKELEAQLEAQKKAIDEQSDRCMRLAAEYDNFRKRSAKEREGAYSDAYLDALKEILPVIDNLERAAQFTDNDKVSEGVKLTLKAFADALEKLGVTEIEAKDKPFDPTLHNAVMHFEDENYGEGIVAEVFQKGYKKGDKVLRYAMVKVAN